MRPLPYIKITNFKDLLLKSWNESNLDPYSQISVPCLDTSDVSFYFFSDFYNAIGTFFLLLPSVFCKPNSQTIGLHALGPDDARIAAQMKPTFRQLR